MHGYSRCTPAAKAVGCHPTYLLSDALHFTFGIESLRYALLLISLPVVAAVYLLFRSSRHATATAYGHAAEVDPITQETF